MSSKQIKKLQEQLNAAKGEDEENEEEEEEDDDPGIGYQAPKKMAFAMMSSSSEEESSDEEDGEKKSSTAENKSKRSSQSSSKKIKCPPTASSSSNQKSSKQKKLEEKRRKQEEEEEKERQIIEDLDQMEVPEEEESQDDENEYPELENKFPIVLTKANFCMDTEFKRVFGKDVDKVKKQYRNEPLHFRKLWLIKPDKPWLKPDTSLGAMEMTPSADGFIVDLPANNEKAISVALEYDQVVKTHDFQALHYFVQQYPYHVNGLLSLAEVCNQRGNFEESSMLIKRALYSLECHFHISFQPFPKPGIMPNVHLHKKSYATLGRALWEYMHTLNGQGLFSTALEVGKFILLCEQKDELVDPLHVTLLLDYFAIRARRYTFFDEIVPLKLHGFLPNVAYNTALCHYNQLSRGDDVLEEINEMNVKDVFWDAPCKKSAPALCRAILMYPNVVKDLLTKAKVDIFSSPEPMQKKWDDIFNNPIFRDTRLPNQFNGAATHAFLYTAVLWTSQQVVQFIYRCCKKMDQWSQAPVIKDELLKSKTEWLDTMNGEEHKPMWYSLNDILASEVRDSAKERIHPVKISEAMEEFDNGTRDAMNYHQRAFNAGPGGERYPFQFMSLQTHPSILIFQSFLPWAEIKHGHPPFRFKPWAKVQRHRLEAYMEDKMDSMRKNYKRFRKFSKHSRRHLKYWFVLWYHAENA